MKNYYFLNSLLILLVVSISSCKKEEIEDPITPNSPVFKAEGTLGTESFDVAAGEDNFYMQTFSDVVNGVDFFSGKLSNGVFEIEMGIYDGNLDISSANFSQGLPENIGFAIFPSQPITTLSKEMLPNSLMIDQVKWYVNGVLAGTNTANIMTPGIYNICANVTFLDGSEGTLCNEMILGYAKHATCQLRHYLSSGGIFQGWVDNSSETISSVKWFIDNVHVSDNIKLITPMDQQSHMITAEISFQNGVKRKKSMLIDGSLSGKFIDDFSVFENATTAVNWDFDVSIKVKKDGKQYISAITNNESATLQITDVNFYGTNSAGKAVIKISADVTCQLKDTATGNLVPFTCSTVFGVEVD